MQKPLKIIILGGYGNFGARIAKRLSGYPMIELVIAGRNLAQAQLQAAQLKNATATQLNIYANNLSASLRALNIDLQWCWFFGSWYSSRISIIRLNFGQLRLTMLKLH